MKIVALVAFCAFILFGATHSHEDSQEDASDSASTISILEDTNINIYNGLTFRTDSTNYGEFTQTYEKLFKFARGYVPEGQRLHATKHMELFTFTEDTHSLQCNGLESSSLSLKTPWVSAKANYDYATSKSNSNGKVKSYLTTRYICKKASYSNDFDQLIIEDNFYIALRSAVTNNENSIDGYEYLVEVLNRYGWYIPHEYTLGGTIYSTKIEEVSTLEDAKTESQKFGAEFNVEFAKYGAGASHSNDKSSETKKAHTGKRNEIQFLQIGGSTFGRDNLDEWTNSLQKPKNWKIIGYASLYPSLMLLHEKDDGLLRNCLHLLKKFHDYSAVKRLQSVIDVRAYQRKIVRQLDSY